MDWERADRELHHARLGHVLQQKNVANKTILRRASNDPSSHEDDIALDVFGSKTVILWHKNGGLTLNNHDYWGYVTKDRLKAFLPRGFMVSQQRPFWFLHTPTGPRPWRNGMEVAKDGTDADLPEPLNRYNAAQLWRETEDYAKELIAVLLRGSFDVGDENACQDCVDRARAEGEDTNALHAFRHVTEKVMDPWLIFAAITQVNRHTDGACNRKTREYIPRQEFRDNVAACFTKGHFLRLKPKTKKMLIRQTELRMTLPEYELPKEGTNPRAYAWNLRRIVADYLLRNIGFEWMSS